MNLLLFLQITSSVKSLTGFQVGHSSSKVNLTSILARSTELYLEVLKVMHV